MLIKNQTSIIYYGDANVWLGTYGFYELEITLPDFWQDKIQHILCKAEELDNYENVIAIVMFRKEHFENIDDRFLAPKRN